MATLDGDVLIHKYELFNEMAVALAELQTGIRDRMTPKDILKMILEAEPVDPVKRGKWLHGREISRDYIGDVCVAIHYEKWWCSECTAEGRPLWHYCPNCGASNEVEA